jgi:hypothetical protein
LIGRYVKPEHESRLSGAKQTTWRRTANVRC